jgi:hypothetical protein
VEQLSRPPQRSLLAPPAPKTAKELIHDGCTKETKADEMLQEFPRIEAGSPEGIKLAKQYLKFAMDANTCFFQAENYDHYVAGTLYTLQK